MVRSRTKQQQQRLWQTPAAHTHCQIIGGPGWVYTHTTAWGEGGGGIHTTHVAVAGYITVRAGDDDGDGGWALEDRHGTRVCEREGETLTWDDENFFGHARSGSSRQKAML